MPDKAVMMRESREVSTPEACLGCMVNRRQFIASSTLAAVAALLSACGGGSDGTGPGGGGPIVSGPVTIKIADHQQLATIGRPVEVPGKNAAAVRIAEGNTASSFAVLSRECTHQKNTVNVLSNGFACPAHGSTFSGTGEVTNGPADRPLARLAFTFNADAGTITVA